MQKRAIPLELFFDLVFVLGITEVTALVVHDLSPGGFAHGALVMAMLWWGWTQYTWAANAIDLQPRQVWVTIIIAMGVALIMAQAVSTAFGAGGMWLAIGYAALRGIGLWKYWMGTGDDPATRSALPAFIRWSSIGPAILITGAFLDDPARSWVWTTGLVFEIGAALLAGRGTWTLNAEHFAERHGLILIIALGESIVAVGSSVSGEDPTASLATVLLIALGGTGLLWWAYFDWLQDHWQEAMEETPPQQQGRYARDVYSFLHYPVISGVVLYAVAAEEMVAHPDEALSTGARVALALGITLYLLGQAGATLRASRRILRDRIVAALLIPLVILIGGDLLASWLIGITVAILLAALAYEHTSRRGRISSQRGT